jgi:peptide/nickel transport system permease protein
MTRYLFLRLLSTFPIAIGMATGIFFFIHLLPGDPIDLMLGEMAADADRTALRSALHLDEPVITQYGRFMAALASGDLGRSFGTKQPVTELILTGFFSTVQLALAALIFAMAVSIPLGLLSALKSKSGIDRGILFFSLFGVSMPNFWLGPLLIILFSLKLDWLPVSGKEGVSSLILPALTLGIGLSSILIRMIRSSVLEVMGKPFILTARAKGVSPWRVITQHLCRNALIPIITLLGLQFGALLTGSIITETIFSWPGLGRLTMTAILSRDYPLVQGCVLVIAMTYLMASLLADILYAVADPRVRY